MATKFNYREGKRNLADSQLETVNIVDLINDVQADDVFMYEDQNGQERVRVLNTESGEYYPIRVGDKVVLEEEGENRLEELLDNFVIYCGSSEAGNKYFTFGPKTSAPTKRLATMDLKKFMAKVGVN